MSEARTEKERIEEAIDDVPPEGWWNDSTRERYLDAGKRLIELGMPQEEAIEFLSTLWSATASEYGE